MATGRSIARPIRAAAPLAVSHVEMSAAVVAVVVVGAAAAAAVAAVAAAAPAEWT